MHFYHLGDSLPTAWKVEQILLEYDIAIVWAQISTEAGVLSFHFQNVSIEHTH